MVSWFDSVAAVSEPGRVLSLCATRSDDCGFSVFSRVVSEVTDCDGVGEANAVLAVCSSDGKLFVSGLVRVAGDIVVEPESGKDPELSIVPRVSVDVVASCADADDKVREGCAVVGVCDGYSGVGSLCESIECIGKVCELCPVVAVS